MRTGDRVFAIICLGLSFWLILEARKFAYMTTYTPGPGFFPLWLGVCLGLLSLYLIINTVRRKKSKEEDEGRLPGLKSLGRVGFIILFIASFIFFMKIFGFSLTVFISVSLILLILEGYSIPKSIFYGAIFSGVSFLIFQYWMGLEFPIGWLGI